MRAGGAVRNAWLQQSGPCPVSWTVRVPLSESDWVNVGDGGDSAVEPSVVAPLASLLRRSIQPKLARAVHERPAPVSPPRIPAAALPLA
jgi:hypothetical protein